MTLVVIFNRNLLRVCSLRRIASSGHRDAIISELVAFCEFSASVVLGIV